MQHESSRADYNNQDSVHADQYPPSYETENTYESHPEVPVSEQYSQQSIDMTGNVASNAQHYDQTQSHHPQNVLFVPMHRILRPHRIITTLTSKLQWFFLISGIVYLFWGGLAISLEVVIIMYSFSTYYRGIWAGSVMLAAGINLLMIGCRTSESMSYILRVFGVILSYSIGGVALAALDLGTSALCNPARTRHYCDIHISYTLKIVIFITLVLGSIYTGVNLAIVKRIHKNSVTVPSASNPSG